MSFPSILKFSVHRPVSQSGDKVKVLYKAAAAGALAALMSGCVPPSGQALFNNMGQAPLGTNQNNAQMKLGNIPTINNNQPEDSIKVLRMHPSRKHIPMSLSWRKRFRSLMPVLATKPAHTF